MKAFDFSLPTHQSVKGILVLFVIDAYKISKSLISSIIVFGVFSIRDKPFPEWTKIVIPLIAIGLVLFFLIKAILTYRNFKFYVTKTDFHLSNGILKKEQTTVPKSKIQNIYIKQNLIQQIINVVELDIETAGDEKAEIEIKALNRAQALQLKQELLSEVNNELKESASKSNLIYQISIKKLILEGVTQNHIKTFGIIMSFFFGAFYQYKDYIEDFGLKMKLEHWFKINEHWYFKALFFVISSIIITIIISVGKTFLVNYNLKVLDKDEMLEIKKGLLNKVSLNLTPPRIQNIEITTNIIKAYLGFYTISIKQAMVNKKQKQNFSIIGLSKLQAYEFLKRFYTNYNDKNLIEKYKPEAYYKRIILFWHLMVILIFNGLTFLLFRENFWVINIVLLPIAFFAMILKYKKAYYSIDEHYLIVGTGLIDTKMQILEHHKIQMVSYSQNTFQKLKNTASVKVHTASDRVKIPYIKSSKAQAITNYLLYKVESSRRDWL